MSKSEEIKTKLEQDGVRYWANDNIADYIKEGDKQQLIDEAVPAFENVLQTTAPAASTKARSPVRACP